MNLKATTSSRVLKTRTIHWPHSSSILKVVLFVP